jgi:hypothetical protein
MMVDKMSGDYYRSWGGFKGRWVAALNKDKWLWLLQVNRGFFIRIKGRLMDDFCRMKGVYVELCSVMGVTSVGAMGEKVAPMSLSSCALGNERAWTLANIGLE